MTDVGWAEEQAMVALSVRHGTKGALIATFAKLLTAEHARSVRIVKARDKWILNGGYRNMSYDFQAGYHQACNDLKTALQRRRTKGGRR